jgi:hypothetical protein
VAKNDEISPVFKDMRDHRDRASLCFSQAKSSTPPESPEKTAVPFWQNAPDRAQVAPRGIRESQ